MIKASEIRKNGTEGTTIVKFNGIGIGYEYNGKVYSDGGNGFYYEKQNLKVFLPDGGKGYMDAIKGIFPSIEKGILV